MLCSWHVFPIFWFLFSVPFIISSSSPLLTLTLCLRQVFDNYAVTVMIGGEPYTLGLFDTAGKDEQKSLIQ